MFKDLMCLYFYFCVNQQTLSGHTSPVESTAFDSAEVLVLAGASSGVIKQWDLEEAKSKFSDALISTLIIIQGYFFLVSQLYVLFINF